MSENVHQEITGTPLVASGTHGTEGELDLWGNKIVKVKQDTRQHLVEYGVVTLKDGEVLDISYKDYSVLMLAIEQGQKGIITFGTKSIDLVMIGKIEAKTRLEDAPVDLQPKRYDKHLMERKLSHYEAEVNLDGKGWKWQNITVENGKETIKKLLSNEDNIRQRVRQLKPVYTMVYVKENVGGKELLVERKPDHHYPNIPLTRIDETGQEVVMWYWAKPIEDDGRGKKKIGYKKVIELKFDEQTSEYVMPSRLDACSPDEVDYLSKGGR